MKWFVRGDIDGFFGLALDNLIQVLLIVNLCGGLLGFPASLIFGSILPGVAVSLIIGNIFYARQAIKLGRETGRSDICALPYGINTPSVFIYIFLVMLPVKLQASANGYNADDAARMAWQAGLVACLGSGVIEFFGAFIAERIRKSAPRAALLSTLSGIALGFISLPFLYRTFANPIVGFATLAVIILCYFGQVRFKGRLPGGFVAVFVGTILAWATGLAPGEIQPVSNIQLNFPLPVIGDLIEAFQLGYFTDFINIIIPMGAFNVIGSLQNIESAEAAGDSFPTAPSLMVNGIGTVAASLFGSCFPTTIYIGHPGWKGLGARAGYSILNAVFITALCITGTAAWVVWAIPIEAGMAIVLWIGIVITSQAFQTTPRKHAPAAVIGVMIGVAAWGAFMAKAGIRAADSVLGQGLVWKEKTSELITAFGGSDIKLTGAFALEQGSIFSAMIFAAATVCIIEKSFYKAALWCLAGAILSAIGLMHSFVWSFKDAPLSLTPAWRWAAAYLIMAACFALAKWVTIDLKPKEEGPNTP
ncbi:MAG: NCS2 family permease [Fibrobacteria bacterium]|nr:NCS2 family permease [Fibrobacteria bacterium]